MTKRIPPAGFSPRGANAFHHTSLPSCSLPLKCLHIPTAHIHLGLLSEPRCPRASQLPPVLPQEFGSGSCVRSAKRFPLEARWSERFFKLRQIEIKQQIMKKVIDSPASVQPPAGSWKEVLDYGWCSSGCGRGTPRQQQMNHRGLCVKGEPELVGKPTPMGINRSVLPWRISPLRRALLHAGKDLPSVLEVGWLKRRLGSRVVSCLMILRVFSNLSNSVVL